LKAMVLAAGLGLRMRPLTFIARHREDRVERRAVERSLSKTSRTALFILELAFAVSGVVTSSARRPPAVRGMRLPHGPPRSVHTAGTAN
jgi:hypothetical protein